MRPAGSGLGTYSGSRGTASGRTFGHRWGAYLSLVLLIGLVGGLSLGALAAARRTESSFPTFLASTNPSNLSLATALRNPALGYTTGYNGSLVATIARLPHVRRAESYSDFYSEPIGRTGNRRQRPRMPTWTSREASTGSTSTRTGSRSYRDGWPTRSGPTRS